MEPKIDTDTADLKDKAALDVEDQNPGSSDAAINWLGEDPKFGYVDILQGEGQDGEHQPTGRKGFYWFWPAADPKAPVLVQFIGGPGNCVLTKAFGCNINPQDVAPDGQTLVKTSNRILDNINLIYIEAPMGSGFSVATKKSRNQDFMGLNADVKQVLKRILEETPDLIECDWYFNGDSFCGVMVPYIMFGTRACLNLKVKGMILESPFLGPLQYWSNAPTRAALIKSGKVYKGCCHQCSCSCYLGCAQTCLAGRCIGPEKFRDCKLLPWSWPGMSKTKTDVSTKQKTKTLTPNPYNLSEPEYTPSQETLLPISRFLFSEKFQNFVSSSKNGKPSPKFHDPEFSTAIYKMAGKIGSNQICGNSLEANVRITLVSGDSDCIVPFKSQEEQVNIWDWSGGTDFKRKLWKGLDKRGVIKRKALGGLEWIRHKHCGNLIWKYQPEWRAECLKYAIESGGQELEARDALLMERLGRDSLYEEFAAGNALEAQGLGFAQGKIQEEKTELEEKK